MSEVPLYVRCNGAMLCWEPAPLRAPLEAAHSSFILNRVVLKSFWQQSTLPFLLIV